MNNSESKCSMPALLWSTTNLAILVLYNFMGISTTTMAWNVHNHVPIARPNSIRSSNSNGQNNSNHWNRIRLQEHKIGHSFSRNSMTARIGRTRSRWTLMMGGKDMKDDEDDCKEKEEETMAMGLNELQTLLRQAVKVEDYMEAKRLRDILAERVSSGAYNSNHNNDDKRKKKRLSWRGLGTARWLEDRLDALDYKFPTTIQINAFESVNTILGAFQDDEIEQQFASTSSSTSTTMNDTTETLEELMDRMEMQGLLTNSMGVVISGSTGSGKTLAYMVPMLSTLSESLFTRQRIRVKSEEDIGDIAGDLIDRVAVQTSPSVRGHGREQVGGGKKGTIATGASLGSAGFLNSSSSSQGSGSGSMGKSGLDVRNPLALIVVPTRELGVQTALLLYELVGGSTKKTALQMSGLQNMFKYKGPKGVKIGCILDEDEAKYGLKLQTDVAITTPKFLPKLLRDGDITPSKLRVVIYDEADLALEQTSDDDLQTLFHDDISDRNFSRLTYLVGASVTESLGKLCVTDSVLPQGNSFIATATRFAPLVIDQSPSSDAVVADDKNIEPNNQNNNHPNNDYDNDQNNNHQSSSTEENNDKDKNDNHMASFQDLKFCLDPGLRHERIIAPNDSGLICLARMLRKELKQYEEILQNDPDTSIQRPRVVVFFPGEEEARAAIEPMRDAMWGEHKLCVLLPNTGVNPLTIMEQFKNGQTSVMLATPNSVRGLDFPNLSHVYTLYLPTDDPREYLHLAGRVGRIGQAGSVAGMGGRVTSILDTQNSEQMDLLSNTLGFDYVDLNYVPADNDIDNTNIEDLRRYLEDKLTLLTLAEDPVVNPEKGTNDDN